MRLLPLGMPVGCGVRGEEPDLCMWTFCGSKCLTHTRGPKATDQR